MFRTNFKTPSAILSFMGNLIGNMKIAVLVSETDPGGMNVYMRLLETGEFEDTGKRLDGHSIHSLKGTLHMLYKVSTPQIHSEDIDKRIDADFFIFASKHKSASGIPSLTCHSIGNFGKAELGGREKEIVSCFPSFIRRTLELMDEELQKNPSPGGMQFEAIQEATHHGPYSEKPMIFLELGSDEKGWENREAAAANARVIVRLLKEQVPEYEPAIGFGGPHATPNFRKVMQKSNLAFSFIAAKYSMQDITEDSVRQMLEKTLSNGENGGVSPQVVLDWKGLGGEKQRLAGLLAGMGLEFKRTDDF